MPRPGQAGGAAHLERITEACRHRRAFAVHERQELSVELRPEGRREGPGIRHERAREEHVAREDVVVALELLYRRRPALALARERRDETVCEAKLEVAALLFGDRVVLVFVGGVELRLEVGNHLVQLSHL